MPDRSRTTERYARALAAALAAVAALVLAANTGPARATDEQRTGGDERVAEDVGGTRGVGDLGGVRGVSGSVPERPSGFAVPS